jgi:release factor glutamine methyltransferase
MNEEFFVDKNVLIPRPETEILVERAGAIIKQRFLEKKDFKIIDIGTGSGCISVMLAKMLPAEVIFASDISEKALEIARKNAQKHHVEDRINFVLSDLFSNLDEKFDLIISNPPYIPLSMKANLQKEVVLHEPQNALFANDEAGIEFYEKIIEQSQNFLNADGIIIFELGINQFEKVKELFLKNGFKNICIVKDLNHIERIISACKI